MTTQQIVDDLNVLSLQLRQATEVAPIVGLRAFKMYDTRYMLMFRLSCDNAYSRLCSLSEHLEKAYPTCVKNAYVIPYPLGGHVIEIITKQPLVGFSYEDE